MRAGHAPKYDFIVATVKLLSQPSAKLAATLGQYVFRSATHCALRQKQSLYPRNTPVGLGVGAKVGSGVGLSLGTGVGLSLGGRVGPGVGESLGLGVGANDGTKVGTGVGASLGGGDGARLGAGVGK